MSRAARRAVFAISEFFRIIPILREGSEEKVPLGSGSSEESALVSVVDRDFHGVTVIKLPKGASEQMARKVEEEMTALIGSPVLVVGSNIEFFAVKKLNDEEKKKIIEEIIPKQEPVREEEAPAMLPERGASDGVKEN